MQLEDTLLSRAIERVFARCLPVGECLVWQGGTTVAGYSQLMVAGHMYYGHRLVARYCYGPEETWDGPYVCHHCDTPNCVNPAHLYHGTARHNAADAVSRNRASAPPHFFGPDHPLCRLQPGDEERIRQERACGASINGLAKRFGTTRKMVRKIVNT